MSKKQFLRDALCSPCEVLTPRDEEASPLLAGDRAGFALTRENARRRDVLDRGVLPQLDLQTYTDYDVCYLFPRQVKSPKKLLPRRKIEQTLLRVCGARIGSTVQELSRIDRLHPIYGIKPGDIRDQPRSEVAALLQRVFLKVLEHVGAAVVSEVGKDKREDLFVRARLGESGCQVVADYKKYPLQVDRQCARYPQFRDDPEFVAPYMLYERGIESTNRDHLPEAHLWQRYDRLSRRLYGVEAKHTEASIFRDVDRIRLLRMAVAEFINVDAMIRDGWMKTSFPLKQPAIETALCGNWASLRKIHSCKQPLDDVRNYYGEEIALYFSWLGFYTRGLVVPAAMGVVTYLLVHFLKARDLPHHYVSLSRASYCVFIGVWSALFFARWKRQEAMLALRWGIEQAKLSRTSLEEFPFFRPESYRIDPADPNKFIRHFSPHKRAFRRFLTTVFLVVSTCVVTFLVNDDLSNFAFSMIRGRDTDGMPGEPEGGLEQWMVSIFSPNMAKHASYIALATSISVKGYNSLWQSMVSWRLGEFENHQYWQDYNDSAHLKLFIFKVANYFVTLYYIGFFKQTFGQCTGYNGSCVPELAKQLAMFYVTDLTGAIVEVVSPYATYLVAKIKNSPQPNMPAYQYQSYLKCYSGVDGQTADFLDKMIQFGYTALFSVAFPVLPLLGMIVNAVELRTDALKLCKVYQRPFPRQGETMGTWDDLQRAMTFFGILSNVFLCCFATIGSEYGVTVKLSSCLVMTVVALALKDYVEYKVPSESPAYRLLKTRMQVVDHEALWGPRKAMLTDGKQQAMTKLDL